MHIRQRSYRFAFRPTEPDNGLGVFPFLEMRGAFVSPRAEETPRFCQISATELIYTPRRPALFRTKNAVANQRNHHCQPSLAGPVKTSNFPRLGIFLARK